MFLRLAELLVFGLVFLVFLTQIWVPISKGRGIFPVLRKQGRLETELVELKQQEAEKNLEANIEKEKLKLVNKNSHKRG